MAGLTTALALSKNHSYKITVCAKYMPGDYDIEYASPWAGANYLPSVSCLTIKSGILCYANSYDCIFT